MISIVQVGVVGNEQVVLHHFFHHRMAAVLDIDDAPAVHFRPDIIIFLRHKGQGGENVDRCQGPGCRLNSQDFFGNRLTHIGEQVVFHGK